MAISSGVPLRNSACFSTGGTYSLSMFIHEPAVPTSDSLRPVSARVRTLISFCMAFRMPIIETYLGSFMPVWTETSAGRRISICSSSPPSSSRFTLAVPVPNSSFLTIVACGMPSSSARIGPTMAELSSPACMPVRIRS